MWDTPARRIAGYAANVKSLRGKGYALLGNAGEFLDPVFSSGVTIAVKSASLAAGLIGREWARRNRGLGAGLRRAAEEGRGHLPRVRRDLVHRRLPEGAVLSEEVPEVRRMIASVLAGYAWDEKNPFVSDPRRRMNTLEELCST